MADPTTTGSAEQPEEFPFETIIADYLDQLVPKFATTTQKYKKLIWVKPDSSDEFKKSFWWQEVDLLSKYNIKNELDILSQLQIAGITPTISLYRRDYKSDELDTGSYKDRLFLFNSTAPENASIQLNGLTRDQFLEQQLRGAYEADPALMASSFNNLNVTFAGRNPIESERSIDVSMEIKFASFEGLVGTNTPAASLNLEQALVGIRGAGPFPSDSTDYTDPNGSTNIVGVTKNFLSLITHPPSDEQVTEFEYDKKQNNTVYYPNKFRVYLRLGWRAVASSEVFPPQFDNFVNSINAGEHDKYMLLNLINHELTFDEEGQVQLKVNYIGSLDTSLTSTDSDFIKALYELHLRQIEETNTELTQESSSIKAAEQINKWVEKGCAGPSGISSDSPIDAKRKQLEEKSQKLKSDLKTKKQNALNTTYSRFLNAILDDDGYKSIKALSITGNQAATYSSGLFDKQRNTGLMTEIFNNPVYSSDKLQKDAKSDTKDLQEGIAEQEADSAGATEPWYTYLGIDTNLEDVEELRKNTVKIDPSGFNDNPLNQVFKMISVGTLLDGMLKATNQDFQIVTTDSRGVSTTRTNNFMKKFYIVLGEFYYKKRSTTDVTPIRLPISLIPINFDTFLLWYKDNIVAKQRKNYVIKDFISDFFTQLVIPTLQGNSTSTEIGRKYNVFFDQKTIKSFGTATTPFLIDSDRSVSNSMLEPVSKYASYSTTSPDDHNIIYISLKPADPDALGRVYESIESDRRENISHFWVGDSRGLIKSIKFKRVEQPGLKEAKATKESFIPLNQLRDLYNADITMFGNHYYYPGDTIFIHPQNSILGEPYTNGTISNIMGIGGYYDVIKVTTNIGEGGYETALECVWVCSGEPFVESEVLKTMACKAIAEEYDKAAASSGVADSAGILKT
ncbi:MAG: hypothetical protein RIR47_1014 [Bacteroidota bacterium]|jgi:hypothetical protein